MVRFREVANGVLIGPPDAQAPEGYVRDPGDPTVFHPKKYCRHREVTKTHVSECGCTRYTHRCTLKQIVTPHCYQCSEKSCE